MSLQYFENLHYEKLWFWITMFYFSYCKMQNIPPTFISPSHGKPLFQSVLNPPSYSIDYSIWEYLFALVLNLPNIGSTVLAFQMIFCLCLHKWWLVDLWGVLLQNLQTDSSQTCQSSGVVSAWILWIFLSGHGRLLLHMHLYLYIFKFINQMYSIIQWNPESNVSYFNVILEHMQSLLNSLN